MTPHNSVRRDLQWWTSVPSQSNGKPIHRPVETAYLHTDSSGYGWGGVWNGMLEARGFWSSADERQHITRNELKAVMDVDTAQHGAAEAPGKGKAATSARHKEKKPRGRSHSGGITRNRSMSKRASLSLTTPIGKRTTKQPSHLNARISNCRAIRRNNKQTSCSKNTGHY
eukprot:jgi/Tetstr1/429247/TSEL_001910.t1